MSSKPKKLPACDPCRSMKLACDHAQPVCTRCTTRGRAAFCRYRPKPFKRAAPSANPRLRAPSEDTFDQVVTPIVAASAQLRTSPSIRDDSLNQSVQYPNPGYLGSSSHTTLFDQLRLPNGHESDASGPEFEPSPGFQSDLVVDSTNLAKGAEFILELHRLSSINSFTQLYNTWAATGTNLALAGPLTGPCATAVDYVISRCDGTLANASVISKRLFSHSCRSISVDPNTSFDAFCANFCGENTRWESFGLFFTAVCRATVDLAYAEPLYRSEQQRRKLQKLTLSYSDRCLDFCLPLDCMNDLQLFLQYENFISHSQIDGDQSYLSWQKLGDVAASLFALGYHQQQTETFQAVPQFLRNLRQIAFCRTYSADKNVSIFLGRPPRICRKFCRFTLPGNPTGTTLEASRKTQVWDRSQGPVFLTDSRWAALCGILKEDILSLLTEENYDERARQSRQIHTDINTQWNAVPENCRLQCSLKACNRRPVERDFMVNMKLNYLHVQFLAHLALLRPNSPQPDLQLFSISVDMLSLVVETIMLKDQMVNSGTSLVWKVAYYGLSAAGLICSTLVNNSFSTIGIETKASKVFQDLSILVGEVEQGTLVYVDSPNYALFARATQTIKIILDRMISWQMMTLNSSNQQLPAMGYEGISSTGEGGGMLWDTNSLQDFETNFWLNLAGHPFLNT